jgi:alpha-tubulin suppressor-like RCC1 family protein
MGVGFICANLTDGTVRCWGENKCRRLGDGTTNQARVPVAVQGLRTAIAMSAGYFHACALLKGGLVSCWGRNNHGQLGNGTTVDSPIPVP